jgi:hypothetical protein
MTPRFRKRAIMMMGLGTFLCIAPSKDFWSVEAATSQVNINVNIGQPPPVIVHERPTMVYLPEPAAYVAVGIPFDVFFVSGRYYYLHGNDWFWGTGYNGPWAVVAVRSLPPGLQKYKIERLHEFREREYRVYKVEGPKFKGKHFEADEFRDDHDNKSSHESDGNNGRGNGRGNGKK